MIKDFLVQKSHEILRQINPAFIHKKSSKDILTAHFNIFKSVNLF